MKNNRMWTKPRELEEAFFAANPELIPCQEEIMQACTLLNLAFSFQKKLLVCGNDDSSAESDIIVSNFMRSLMLPRHLNDEQKALFTSAYGEDGKYLAENLQSSLRAISLTPQPQIKSASSIDLPPPLGLAQSALGLTDEGDVFLGLIKSGGEEEILSAMMVAKMRGAKCIALTGADTGKFKDIADLIITLPTSEASNAKEYSLTICHFLASFVEANFFG